MAATVAHRGPDSEGVWIDGPVGLGHRRLAIIDLSPAGHQPMGNETGDVVIVYNGELFNFQKLRVELEGAGHRFHSSSDTEAIIHAYEEWGEGCLERFNGQFAFAIWDSTRQRLFLARDRFGVKPLYYTFDGLRLLFGSEIKSLLAYPGMKARICYEALNEYFTFQNVLTDLTLFDGVKLLPAGCTLTLDLRTGAGPVQRRYWDFLPGGDPLDISACEAEEEVYRLFNQAVTRQLMSDVPIACYLSGGMDSGSITAVARQQLGRLMTFTCGFDLSSASGLELSFDERAESEALSNALKTEHYEMVLHAGDMEHIMPELMWHLEDPRVGQCYPNYYVARLAGKFVKVVLSGTGGDELFGGYPWRYSRGLMGHDKEGFLRHYYEFWQRLAPDSSKRELFNPDVQKHIHGHSTFQVFRGLIEPFGLSFRTREDFVGASLYFELKTFLHGLLIVEDKISMAHSLETRTPFLDNDLVDFALRLPVHHKLRILDPESQLVDENDASKGLRYDLRTANGKVVLRGAMNRIVSNGVTDRAKQGFSAPDASWFRGESIDYINSLLRHRRARIYDFIDHAFVERLLDEHTAGKHNHRLFIWSLLSFEWWIRIFNPVA